MLTCCIVFGMTETVRYTYRLRPGMQAERALVGEWGRCRWLWNEAVHQTKTGRKPTMCKLSKLLTDARGTKTWLRDGSQVAQQQMLRSYAQSLNHSFNVKGRGRPTFKARKKVLPSLEYTTRGFSIREGRLILPKGVSIPVVWSRDLPSEPSSVRVYQDSLEHWYASFVVTREAEPVADVEGGIGIDWGISVTATATDPAYDLPYGAHAKDAAAALAKYQRRTARRNPKPGQSESKGYQRAKHATAKLHKKVARQRQHTARVWARRVVADHQMIAVENFKPKFLSQSTMARKAADAAIGITKRTLIEYAERAGRQVVMVKPAYTTMTCGSCGTRAKERLLLNERTFFCIACGLIEGRDRNAARTILAVAERGHTSVDDVRHALPPFGLVAAAI